MKGDPRGQMPAPAALPRASSRDELIAAALGQALVGAGQMQGYSIEDKDAKDRTEKARKQYRKTAAADDWAPVVTVGARKSY